MLITITGANGWLGLNLVRAVSSLVPRQAVRVRAIVFPGTPVGQLHRLMPSAEVVGCDIRDIRQCEAALSAAGDPEHVLIHTAGVIHPNRVKDFYSINVDGTSSLLDAAVRARISRAVLVSSNSPCGFNPIPEHRFDEHSPYAPYMNYGRSKMLMERDAWARHHRGDYEVVIVRTPWFYGPFQPERQLQFFRMIRDGRFPVVGDGRNLRSMASTKHLADGLLLAAQSPRASGQLYWMADETPYAMNHIVTKVATLLREEFQVACARRQIRLPRFVSDVAWAADWTLQKLGLYNQKVHVLSELSSSIACSVRKAKEDLGFRPAQSLDEGMRESISEWLGRGR